MGTGAIHISGKRANSSILEKRYSFFQADATHIPLADKSVDLVFGSPPYCDGRTYGIDAQRGCIEWVEWMIQVTLEAQRVCRGPVLWVAAGVTRKRNYWPACEGLMWEWWKRGGDCQLYRPCFWHRVGIPGSGGKDWFRADVEYVLCFKGPGELAWARSGTTVDAAVQEDRIGPGSDIRASQCELGLRRLRNPHARKAKRQTTPKADPMLFSSSPAGGGDGGRE